MQPRLLLSILVVLVIVIVCILTAAALWRLLRGHADRSAEMSQGSTFDLHVVTLYGRLVRYTLDWLDDHHVPVHGFARSVIDQLFPTNVGGQAPHSAEEQLNHQDIDRAVSSTLHRPPPAYY